ncbi:MAG: polysaccharide deacetylase family protein [Acidobacteria bacterium]|nr:polysaccharide deacetylase family protein [Acidobacteriota bacterium]
MRAITLMYHDVVEARGHEASGFPWPDAALYKLEPEQFTAHLDAIAGALCGPPCTVSELTAASSQMPVLLTFDDGGVSSYTRIADQLEEHGWRGHFFITAGQIGTSAFVSREQIRDLRRRGHIIGSHSFSHPLRMAQCSWPDLVGEWWMSVGLLSDILGEQVSAASVPGGQYTRKIAEAASMAGIEALFTSEPITKWHKVDGCTVYGRFAIQRWMSPCVAADLVAGKAAPRLRQLIWWNAKKVIKTLGGEYYLKLRNTLTGERKGNVL